MTKRVVVRVAARGYVDGRYIGEEKEVIEAVDPSGRGKRGRGKSAGKNDNIGNDNRGNRVAGRGGKRGDARTGPRGAGGAAGAAKDGSRRRQARGAGGAAGSGTRDGNVMPGVPGAPSPRTPRQPRQTGERNSRGGRGGNPRAPGAAGNSLLPGGDVSGNAGTRARRGRGGKKTPFRVGAGGPNARPGGINPDGPRALISEVAETRRWGDESKSGQFAEALAKEETVKRERLHKVLAQSGHGSRRDMEIMISSGRVMVNGIVATTGTSVSPSDAIMIDRHLVKLKFDEALPRVLLYHKPEGEIVTTNDPGNRITVFDNLPPVENGKWMSIGRLDINTSGLLIFTTSGELANRLMHPRYEVEREYAVRVLGELTDEQTARLLAGVSIAAEPDEDEDETPVEHPAKFDSIDKRGGEGVNQWYHVVLREGRNREVRKMFEAVGLTVSRLIRVRFGKIGLPPRLTRGRMVELDTSQVRAVLKWVGMEVEGHIGALPTNTQPNRGQRKSADPQGDGEAAGQRERGEPRGRGRRGRGRESAALPSGESTDFVAGDAAVRDFQESHSEIIAGDIESGLSVVIDASASGQQHGAKTTEQPPRQGKGRGRNARRSRGGRDGGQLTAGGQTPADGNESIGNLRGKAAIGNNEAPRDVSDNIGNQIRNDSFGGQDEGPDDAIGNRIAPVGGNPGPRGNPPTNRGGRSSSGAGRGQGRVRTAGNAGGQAAADGGRRHSRGRRKPPNGTDNSGNR